MTRGPRYKIVRMFFKAGQQATVKRGLTLEEAQAHCKNPETNSATATSPAAVRRTEQRGPWFDGYTQENR